MKPKPQAVERLSQLSPTGKRWLFHKLIGWLFLAYKDMLKKNIKKGLLILTWYWVRNGYCNYMVKSQKNCSFLNFLMLVSGVILVWNIKAPLWLLNTSITTALIPCKGKYSIVSSVLFIHDCEAVSSLSTQLLEDARVFCWTGFVWGLIHKTAIKYIHIQYYEHVLASLPNKIQALRLA